MCVKDADGVEVHRTADEQLVAPKDILEAWYQRQHNVTPRTMNKCNTISLPEL
jgi:hypothetical protein